MTLTTWKRPIVIVHVLVANLSHFYTMHVDVYVEGKQVQIECQVELYSIERYSNIIMDNIIAESMVILSINRLPKRILVALVALQQYLYLLNLLLSSHSYMYAFCTWSHVLCYFVVSWMQRFHSCYCSMLAYTWNDERFSLHVTYIVKTYQLHKINNSYSSSTRMYKMWVRLGTTTYQPTQYLLFVYRLLQIADRDDLWNVLGCPSLHRSGLWRAWR